MHFQHESVWKVQKPSVQIIGDPTTIFTIFDFVGQILKNDRDLLGSKDDQL